MPVDRSGRVDVAAYAGALDGGGVAAAVLQTANAEVGTRQPVTALEELCRARGVPLLLDAGASLGRDPHDADPHGAGPRGAGSVLVADAASFGGPPLGLLAVRTGTRWSLPGPRRDAEQGREAAAPWVPLVLAAAEAWRQTDADSEREAHAARELVGRIRRASAAVPDVEVVGADEDRLPHVVTFSVLYADGEVLLEELAARGPLRGVGVGVHLERPPSQPRARRDGRPHPRQRPGDAPLGAVSPTREADVDRLCRELPDAVAAVRRRLGTEDL